MATSSFTMFVLAFLGLSATASAHSWVEQLTVIAPNGSFVGAPGFARGNVLRTTAGFNDGLMVHLLPPNGRANQVLDSDPMCKETQQSQTQSDGSPRLQAAAGAAIALRYQENGHVTLPQNQPGKPANRGTVFVYGTTQPKSDDNLLAIHKVWNADGSGGDKRGVLLSTENFDDGQCYQVNPSDISQQRQKQFSHQANNLMGGDLWCQQDIALPTNAPSGQLYTLYWVWDWPTAAGADPGLPDGKQEIYTTCMDIDVVADGHASNKGTSSGFIDGQPLENAAVASEFSHLGNPTAVAAPSDPAAASSTPPAPSTTLHTQPASAVAQTPGSSSSQSTVQSTTILPIPTPGASTGSIGITPSSKTQSLVQSADVLPAQTVVASTTSSSMPPSSTTGLPMQSTTVLPIPPSRHPSDTGSATGNSKSSDFPALSLMHSAPTTLLSSTRPSPSSTVTQYDTSTETSYQTTSPTGLHNKIRRSPQDSHITAVPFSPPLRVIPVIVSSNDSTPRATMSASSTSSAAESTTTTQATSTLRALAPERSYLGSPASSSSSPPSADIVFVTVTKTVPVSSATASPTTSTDPKSCPYPTGTPTAGASQQVGPTASQGYKLRGRNPFFMPPESDRPSPTTGPGASGETDASVRMGLW